MKSVTQLSKREIGIIGENIASRLLYTRGFVILARNYRRKIGEIDIIACINERIYFFEVKTAYLKIGEPKSFSWTILEEKINSAKYAKIYRLAEMYLSQYGNASHYTKISIGTICIAIRKDLEVFSYKVLKDVVM